MTQYEMTENLSRKMNVTMEEAKAALEAGDWNTLTATHLLEQEKFRRMQELNAFASDGEAVAVQYAPEADEEKTAAADEQPATAERIEWTEGAGKKQRRGRSGLGNVGDHIRRLVACGNRDRFEVRKGDEPVLELPVTVLALLLIFAFWACVPLLVIGLFAGCRYSFSGRELGRDGINGALAKAARAANQLKETVAEA